MTSEMFCFPLLLVNVVYSQNVFVSVNDGKLRGILRRVDNIDLEVYLGIPFAEPPVGELRFKRPFPPKGWDGVRDATWYGPACPQHKLDPKYNLSMAEDCLYLNVYTTVRTNSSSRLPVLVHIHGGTFLTGSGAVIDPSVLAVRGVVIVTINYRLGVLGFLSMGDCHAPGNYGMMDQVMALTWVRDNIAHFGGNPNDVTLLGYSAGGASVSLHMLSPLSRGLFHKVISQSGSSMAPWAAATNEDDISPRDMALALAAKVNCLCSDSGTVLSCLRGVSSNDLVHAGRKLKSSPRRLVWSPVVETYYNFLPDLPRAIAEKGGAANVPVLLGANTDEYAGVVAKVKGSETGISPRMFGLELMLFALKYYPHHQDEVKKGLETLYLKSVNTSDPTAIRSSDVNMITDMFFMAPAILESEILTNATGRKPVYLYRLGRRPDNAPSPLWQGVTHDMGLVIYSFGLSFMDPSLNNWKLKLNWTDQDREFTRYVINMTVNFVKTGNPTPTPVNGLTWKPFTTSEKNYVYLELQPEMKSDLRPRDMEFWNSDIPKMLNEQVSSTLLLTLCAASDVHVTTKNGRLRGVRTAYNGQYVDVYKGIPYALPPTGARRFKNPSPATPWSGERDATFFRSACPQGAPVNANNEDCLHVNIFSLNSKNPLPVMVYIHGGGYARETASDSRFDGSYLALNSVVVVTVEYRLGALGFLATEDNAAPGNYGVMDQVLALKWIKQNIADFGGDPNRVTLFGQSAGSSCVSFHLTSPLSKGLFHSAIMESGVSLTAWSVQRTSDKPSPLEQARSLGRIVGCSQTNTDQFIECMRKVSVKNLLAAQGKVKPAPARISWSPVVPSPFLPDIPLNLMNKGKLLDIPTLRGVNKDEYALLVRNVIKDIDQGVSMQTIKEQIRIAVQDRFHTNQQAVETAIENLYLKNVSPTDHSTIRSRLIELMTDVLFYLPTVRESEIQSAKSSSKAYMYEFDYRSTRSRYANWQGVPHGAELDYVFGMPFFNSSGWAPLDKTLSKRMMGYFTNFVKTGNPSYGGVTWQPYTVNRKSYLSIGSSSVMKTDARSTEEKLWFETLPKLVNMKNPIIVG